MAKKPPYKHLVEAMAARGITQAELSRRTGASTGTVANWCTGTRGVGLSYALILRDILDLNPRIWAATPAPRPRRDAAA